MVRSSDEFGLTMAELRRTGRSTAWCGDLVKAVIVDFHTESSTAVRVWWFIPADILVAICCSSLDVLTLL